MHLMSMLNTIGVIIYQRVSVCVFFSFSWPWMVGLSLFSDKTWKCVDFYFFFLGICVCNILCFFHLCLACALIPAAMVNRCIISVSFVIDDYVSTNADML